MPEMIWTKRATILRSVMVLAGAMTMTPAMAQSTVSTGVGTPFELAFWQSIDSSGDPSLYAAYLARFPNGTFAEIARVKANAPRPRGTAMTTPVSDTTPVTAPDAAPAMTVPVMTSPAAVPMPAPMTNAAVPPPPPPPPPPVRPAGRTALAYAPVDAQPVAAAAPVEAAAAPASSGTMGELLAALANSQATGDQSAQAPASQPQSPPAAPRMQQASYAIPPQPPLWPVPNVTLPPAFCSVEARNTFHATVFQPAVNTAKRNNDAAVGYMRQLQSLYDQYQLSHDVATSNAIASAAQSYQQLAQTTFSMQAALVRQFNTLMAVPVVNCSHLAQVPADAMVK